MQQSSATQSLHLSFWGLRKIVACSHSSSQCLLVSTVFGTVSSLHPTSFLMIFILVHSSHFTSGQFWNFTVQDPQENCLHEINATDVANCTVYFSICKPLPTSICNESNVSYCQVVTATDGTQYRYNIGNYSSKHNYIALSTYAATKFCIHYT